MTNSVRGMQTPSTFKLRRAVVAVLAASGMGRTVLRRGPLTSAERAAIDLRARGPLPAGNANGVVFLIPLVGRHRTADWDGVQSRLRRTISSFGDPATTPWRALVSGQDRPDLNDAAGVHFIPFTQPVVSNDKWAKLDQLARALPEHAPGRGYAMSFDADDLSAPGLVRRMIDGGAPGGYLVTRGYVRDVGNGRTALARPRGLFVPGQKPFWKLCGSCAALRYDLDHDGSTGTDFLARMLGHEHRMFPSLAGLAGRALSSLPDPAAMYLLNHGDNFGPRRGRSGFKQRFVERFEITDPRTLAQLDADFPTSGEDGSHRRETAPPASRAY